MTITPGYTENLTVPTARVRTDLVDLRARRLRARGVHPVRIRRSGLPVFP
jgi:hypothetical protein